MQCATAMSTARIRELETERESVSRVLREETAQVLGLVLIELATLSADDTVAHAIPDLADLRAAVRSELQRILSIATQLGKPAKSKRL